MESVIPILLKIMKSHIDKHPQSETWEIFAIRATSHWRNWLDQRRTH